MQRDVGSEMESAFSAAVKSSIDDRRRIRHFFPKSVACHTRIWLIYSPVVGGLLLLLWRAPTTRVYEFSPSSLDRPLSGSWCYCVVNISNRRAASSTNEERELRKTILLDEWITGAVNMWLEKLHSGSRDSCLIRPNFVYFFRHWLPWLSLVRWKSQHWDTKPYAILLENWIIGGLSFTTVYLRWGASRALLMGA